MGFFSNLFSGKSYKSPLVVEEEEPVRPNPKHEQILEWLKAHQLLEHFQQFVERPDAFARLTSGMMGWGWEQDFMNLCKKNGLDYEEPQSLNQRFDCTVNGLRVQCKHTSKYPRVDIRNKNKNTKRKYVVSDFDIMALRSMADVYLIPVQSFPTTKLFSSVASPHEESNLLIPGNIDLNNYSYCLNNWSVFNNGS